ncbi:TPA: hypothetical protein HA241_06410 [Candidatus Woesearchaeota archaeon]|nr:hypothetical protein [Candidatus Woesearchaeota archaeon]
MKHSVSVTFVLLSIFLVAQFLGLFIVRQYVDPVQSELQGETVFRALPIGERPQVEEETSYIPVVLAVIIGTVILLVLIKYNLLLIWKIWFLFALIISLTVAFGAFMTSIIAFSIAAILSVWRIFWPNYWIQNLTELFVYGGLAAIFAPLFTLLSVSVLLILIACYDAYAVWRSKHMILLAQSQSKANMFAGLLIPYQWKRPKLKKKTRVSVPVRTAILGGGDVGFPLIFAGVVFKEFGLGWSFVIPVFSCAALAFLLWKGEEKKFYPAMPFLAAGCFVGLGVVMLLQSLF